MPGGVPITQPSALVDPAGLLLDEHLLQGRAAPAAELASACSSRRRPARSRARSARLSSIRRHAAPPASSTSTSRGMTSSAKVRGPRLDVEVVLRQAVHGASARRRFLTDCSVYASVGRHEQPWRRAADAVVVGGGTLGAWCAWFLRRAGAGHVVLLEAGTPRARARAAGRPGWSGRRAAPRPRSGWASATRDFYRSQQRESSASTRASSRRATSCRASPRPRSRTARDARSRCSSGSGLDVRWVEADEFDALEPGRGARATSSGASYAPATATSTRRATSSPTRRRCSRPASRSASARRSPGCDLDRGRVVGGRRPSGGPIATERVVLTGGPQLAAVGDARRHADPGRRGPPPGRRHRAAPRPGARAACRWCSTSPRASTGGRRRAGCCGG